MYLFLERGEEREKEGRKHPCVVASCLPPTGDLAGNGIGDPLVGKPALNPLSYTSQGGDPH